MTHPSFGKYTKEQIQKMVESPFILPRSQLKEVSVYEVHVSREREVSVCESAVVEVNADSEDEARDIVNNSMDWDTFDWEEDDSSTEGTDCYTIERVSLKTVDI